jgi:Peptidase family M28
LTIDIATSRPTSAADATLREVVEALAPLQRRAGSADEHRAAHWIAERLAKAGCESRVEEEQFLDGYAGVIGNLARAGALAGLAALPRRTRKLGGATAALVTAAIADDISNGPRLFRRATSAPRITWNVVAECGDTTAERTLVVLAHHDAAPTGAIFDDRGQAWFGERFPGIIERIDTSLPLWWGMLAAPALIAVGAAAGRRGMIGAGVAGSLVGAAVFADVARRPVALAERLQREHIEGLRMLLVSCGAEEVLQGGIHGFGARHFPGLDRDRTWFLNLDTLGSPKLIMLEGEGPVVMEDYHDRSFRDLIEQAAHRSGASLRRGMRSRNSTDAVIPSRAGFPTATITSMDRYKALSNYHQMSDTPKNVDYTTVLHALTVTEELARELAGNRWVCR